MNPSKDQQQNEDDNTLNNRRIRRGPNRGRGPAMPEPENVTTTTAASTPTFRYVNFGGDRNVRVFVTLV